MTAIARGDEALILAHVLGRPRSWVVAHPEVQLTQAQAERFESLCARRRSGVPIAYVLGNAEFYGHEFSINEHVLVPRPETEHLVDEALRFLRLQSSSTPAPQRVLDVGTGSGAIACTIAIETSATVDATDASTTALEVARENARRLDVSERCRFYHGDLAEPVASNRYDVIVANLPYIPTTDMPKPPDPVSFEPRLATDGGPDGLALYRRLIPALPKILNEDGMILLEAAPPTITELATMLQSTLPNFTVSVHKDYAGLDRYVKALSEGSERTTLPCSGV